MANPLVERRASPRISTGTCLELSAARLRPGRTAYIVDLSAGGALLETDWRLLPGTRVELSVGEPVVLYRTRGRIQRCHVTLLSRERIRYRGAMVFDEQLALDGNERPAGSLCTG